MLKTILLVVLIVMNILAFALYGVDKSRAIHRQWRISEATLILVAALGGGAGALLGMLIFHHKTRHVKFVLLVPIFLAVQIFLVLLLVRGM